ncbi:hypothetical protein D3C81_1994570 [compost metagenome]
MLSLERVYLAFAVTLASIKAGVKNMIAIKISVDTNSEVPNSPLSALENMAIESSTNPPINTCISRLRLVGLR